MGKAAENERIKLWATWLNNVSVGLFIAGVFVPYLAFVQNMPTNSPPTTFHDFLAAFHDFIADTRPYEPQFFKFLAVVLAFITSGFFRHEANKEIAKLQD